MNRLPNDGLVDKINHFQPDQAKQIRQPPIEFHRAR
jgi:hypothetical protein